MTKQTVLFFVVVIFFVLFLLGWLLLVRLCLVYTRTQNHHAQNSYLGVGGLHR